MSGNLIRKPFWIPLPTIVVGVMVFLMLAASGSAQTQRTFSSPEEALQALVEAARTKDREALREIFGPAVEELGSGDETRDAADLDRFSRKAAELALMVKESDSQAVLHLGQRSWPFPIPLVRVNDRWYFDTPAGKEIILNRRIGKNEMTAIRFCQAYVLAQQDYYGEDRDGDNVREYAQQFVSDPGQKNGLFWETGPDEEDSPLGPVATHPGIERRLVRIDPKSDGATPFHGYYFKLLTRQGRKAPGGRYDYIINGNMVAGFALVAYPARWGSSGIMTFMVNQEGRIYEKNLGPGTRRIAEKMIRFNPDSTWKTVQD